MQSSPSHVSRMLDWAPLFMVSLAAVTHNLAGGNIYFFCVRITLICVAYKLSENFKLEMVSLGKDEKSNQQISLHWQLSTFSLVLCILTCDCACGTK